MFYKTVLFRISLKVVLECSKSLGTLKEFEAEFYVKDDEKSHFCKTGTVPYSIRTKV